MADECAKNECTEVFAEKSWQIEQRWKKMDLYRGSQYPPFSIEPLPYERQRLAGSGMTDEDRFFRRQWIKDQELSPNEPVPVAELKPRNFFRRLYMNPADTVFSKLMPVIGDVPASMARVFVPRMFLILCGVYYSYYWIKYNPNDWTRVGGISSYRNKPQNFYFEEGELIVDKQKSDFCDRGFKARTVLRDGKTSGAPISGAL